MENRKHNFEPLCETSEKGEKLFSETEKDAIAFEIGDRILEAFNFQPLSEIAFLLKTNSEAVRSIIEDGRLPPTEILLGIHYLTGVSIDWILTGKTQKVARVVKLRRAPERVRLAA